MGNERKQNMAHFGLLSLCALLCFPLLCQAALLQHASGYADASCSNGAAEAFIGAQGKCVLQPTLRNERGDYALFKIVNNKFLQYSFNDSLCTVSSCPWQSAVGDCENENETEAMGVCNSDCHNNCGNNPTKYKYVSAISTSASSPYGGSSAVSNSPIMFVYFPPGVTDCSGDASWTYTTAPNTCSDDYNTLAMCNTNNTIMTVKTNCTGPAQIKTYTANVCSTNMFVDSMQWGSILPICGINWKDAPSVITAETKTATVTTVATTVAAAAATSVATSVAVAVVAPALTSSVGTSVGSSAAAPAAGGNLMGMIASVQTLALVGGLAAAPASFAEMTSSLDWMNVRFKLPFSSSTTASTSNGRRLTDSSGNSIDMEKVLGTWFWAAVTLLGVTVLRLMMESCFRNQEGVVKYESIDMEEGTKAKKKRFNWRAALSGLLLFPRWEGPAVLFLLPGVGQSIGEAISSTDNWLIIVGTVILVIYPIAFLFAVGRYLHKNIYAQPTVEFIPSKKPFTLKGFVMRDKEVIESGEWKDVSGKKFKKRFGFLFGKQTYQRFGFLYNVLETVRVLLVAVLCGAMNNSDGVAQSAVLFGLSALSFLYCAIVRPFNDRVSNVVQSVTILSQAAIFLITLLQSIDLVTPSFSESVMVPIGFGGIGTHILNQVMTAVLTILSVFNRFKLQSSVGITMMPSQMTSVAKVVVTKGLKQDEDDDMKKKKDKDNKNANTTSTGGNQIDIQSIYLAVDSRMTQLRLQFTERALSDILAWAASKSFSWIVGSQHQLYDESSLEFARELASELTIPVGAVSLPVMLQNELLKTVELEMQKQPLLPPHVRAIADRYIEKILTDIDHVWTNLHRKLLRTCQQADAVLYQASSFQQKNANAVPIGCVVVSLANQFLVELKFALSRSKQQLPTVETRFFSTLRNKLSDREKELQSHINSTEVLISNLWKLAGSRPDPEVVEACNAAISAAPNPCQLKQDVLAAFSRLGSLCLASESSPRQTTLSEPNRDTETTAATPICQQILDIFSGNTSG
eukprot:GILJ01001939.1.p1 GENE.GILJ01001939.1~~GILJ01001939.1.p1  ORF type:complete len:1028 (-),score=188.88 GILJ01001939.1:82-3165(-)